jgi:hypothetical protein
MVVGYIPLNFHFETGASRDLFYIGDRLRPVTGGGMRSIPSVHRTAASDSYR